MPDGDEPQPEPTPEEFFREASEKDRREVREVAASRTGSTQIDQIGPGSSPQEVANVERIVTIRLKGPWAYALLGMMAVQVLIADIVFILYAWLGEDWDLPPGVIEIWLAATVVQLIGLVYVVTGSLFPDRSRGSGPSE